MAGFSDVVGQKQITDYLRNAVISQKVAHAIILEGERFSGKEFIARIFAAALQCENRAAHSGEPC
ncbi:MAG: DNA polymerase III subunit delta, partial [Clostridium sp.]|nr:DNA polymerase III subunit delta [Clostridium sp.]